MEKYMIKPIMFFSENNKEEETELYNKYKDYMRCIFEETYALAYTLSEERRQSIQSEIGKGNNASAIGMLNKTNNTIIRKAYDTVCSRRKVPQNVKNLFMQLLICNK